MGTKNLPISDEELIRSFMQSAGSVEQFLSTSQLVDASMQFEEIESPLDGVAVDLYIEPGGQTIEFHLWGAPDLPPFDSFKQSVAAVVRDSDNLSGSLSSVGGVLRGAERKPRSSYHILVRGFSVTPDFAVANSFLKKLADSMV